ncbi:MAG: hypothetical protein ACI4PC_10260 [Oscillospiraceae bacterium]
MKKQRRITAKGAVMCAFCSFHIMLSKGNLNVKYIKTLVPIRFFHKGRLHGGDEKMSGEAGTASPLRKGISLLKESKNRTPYWGHGFWSCWADSNCRMPAAAPRHTT